MKISRSSKVSKAIGGRWGFRQKDNKAQLVAKGYAQKKGIHYNEIFYPIVKHPSIQMLLAIAARLI